MPKGIYVHKLSNINLSDLLADCAFCGESVEIKIVAGGKTRCRQSVRDAKQTEASKANRRAYQRKRYAENPATYVKKQPHGLTISEAREFRLGKSCELCGETSPELLCIDHDHVTGTIRGVLCRKHNSALGVMGDSEDAIVRVLEYLRKSSGA